MSPEIYSLEKLVYNVLFVMGAGLYLQDEGFLILGFALIPILFLTDIVLHAVGKKIGIATFQYRTFKTRNLNGKILSVLVHTVLWVLVLALKNPVLIPVYLYLKLFTLMWVGYMAGRKCYLILFK